MNVADRILSENEKYLYTVLSNCLQSTCRHGHNMQSAINWANFVFWCMLYTYEGNKMHLCENDAVLPWVNH